MACQCGCCKGACCEAGQCAQKTCAECVADGGVFQGNAVPCDGGDCPCDPPADPNLCQVCRNGVALNRCNGLNCCGGNCQAAPCECDEDADCDEGQCCNAGVCVDCCVECACTDSCVNFTFTHLGDLQVPDTPTDVDYKSEMEADSCTDDNPSPCFEFGYVVGFEPQYADYTGACSDNDSNGDYLWFHSRGGEPYGRLRCLENGDFVFELCVFNVCSGTESSAGRLTKKTYAVTVGEDDCPSEIGSELSSEVSDLQFDTATGEWEPLDETIDLDGEVPQSQTGQLWCNQDCWGEWPFDFVVGTIDGPDCNPLP